MNQVGQMAEPLFTLATFCKMIQQPLFLGGDSIGPVTIFFEHMTNSLYFNRFEGLKDLVEELKYNLDHAFA